MSCEDKWWREAFQAEYLDLYAHRDDESARREVAGISQKLGALPGPLLDACCGNGRHAEALLARGFDVYAFDYSSDLIHRAGQRSSLHGRLFQADIQALPLRQSFAAITLFFTAFGYFDDASNARVLLDLNTITAVDGLLMLDLPNPQHVRDTLVPASEKTTASGLHITERRYFDGPCVIKDVSISADGSVQRSYSERVRLYEEDELRRLAAAAGYRFDSCWPGLLGPDEDQQRKVFWFKN